MIKKLTLTLVAFLAVVIGFLTIAPSEMSFDDAGYNSKNALEHLQVIADKPHSVTDYEAHEEVRQYILNVSKGFVGEENVRERNYLTPSNKNPTDGIEYVGADLVEANEIDCEYDIRNVLACLNGKSETGVLLVAHYASASLQNPTERATTVTEWRRCWSLCAIFRKEKTRWKIPSTFFLPTRRSRICTALFSNPKIRSL